MSTVVIMPGGFHPFHAGHYALYQSAKKAFPGAEVYVAATNDQSERPFPFSLKEKLAKLAGVEPGHFVQVKSPFQSKEITQHFNPEEDVLIFVRSEKDKNESPKPGGIKKDGTPAYFQPWTGKDVQPFAKHAYFAYLPTVEFGPGITSATQIRKAWPTLNDKRKTALVMSLYPAAQKNPKLAQNVVGMFDQVMGSVEESELDEGWKEKLAGAALAGTMALGSSGAGAQTMPNINQQQLELANKYYTVLVQRAKEDGQQLDTRTLNVLRAKAHDAAAQKMSQSQGQSTIQKKQDFPSQGSERRVAKDIAQFEAANPAQQAAIAIAMKKAGKKPKHVNEDHDTTVSDVVVDFYKPIVKDVHKEKVDDYVDQARDLMHKAKDVETKEKLLQIFKKGKENPYLQGGIITTVGALLAGGVLNSAQSLGLNPQQTNMALQGILNTVIPTLVSRINGKNWVDTIKYTLASASVGMGIAGLTEEELDENLGTPYPGSYEQENGKKHPSKNQHIVAMTNESIDYLDEV